MHLHPGFNVNCKEIGTLDETVILMGIKKKIKQTTDNSTHVLNRKNIYTVKRPRVQ